MKTKTWVGAGAAVLLLIAATVSQGAAVDFKNIDADATWMAHVDVDAAFSSQVIKTALKDCLRRHDEDGRWGEFLEHIRLDPHKDLHSITLYGSRIAPGEGVAILHARLNMNAVLRRLRRAPDHEILDYGDYRIHAWTKYHWTRYPREVAATFYKPEIFVMASSVDQLKSALDVLDGKTPSLAGKESPLTAEVPQGAVAIARAINVDKADLRGRFPVARLIKQASYVVGEHEGNWFKNVTITANSPQTAEKLKQVVEGHRAMFWLRFHDRPEVITLLENVKVDLAGDTLKVSLNAPVDKVTAAIPTLCQAFREHLQWHARTWMKMERAPHWWERRRGFERRYEREDDR